MATYTVVVGVASNTVVVRVASRLETLVLQGLAEVARCNPGGVNGGMMIDGVANSSMSWVFLVINVALL